MRYRTHTKLAAAAALAALTLACGSRDDVEQPTSTAEVSPRAGLKIPVTTRSDEARDLYLQGRDLSDRLRATEARHFYLQALKEDRHFALAHLALASSSTSAREFFEAMERAVALAEVVSDGERLMILSMDAGVRGDAVEQLGYLVELVELYPDDERAHLALGALYGARQEYDLAIEHLSRAVEIEPGYSTPYNQLGYTYRTVERYGEAERAFLKYIELIPDEPNPYDSYAELLMKTGRFEESIENYEKALAIKPDFLFSFVGIGHNLIFLGRAGEAREVFDLMFEKAHDVGEKRTAMLWKSMAHIYDGDNEAALEVTSDMFAMAEQNDDPVSMASDRIRMGLILLEGGDPDRALERFIDAVRLVGSAGVPEDVKENTKRSFLYWKTRVELERGRLKDALSELEAYKAQVAGRDNPFDTRRVHELEGEVELARGDAETALQHLGQANRQDPRVLWLMARAHRAAGNLGAARDYAARAAEFNGLAVGYAFVRGPASELLAELQAQSSV